MSKMSAIWQYKCKGQKQQVVCFILGVQRQQEHKSQVHSRYNINAPRKMEPKGQAVAFWFCCKSTGHLLQLCHKWVLLLKKKKKKKPVALTLCVSSTCTHNAGRVIKKAKGEKHEWSRTVRPFPLAVTNMLTRFVLSQQITIYSSHIYWKLQFIERTRKRSDNTGTCS